MTTKSSLQSPEEGTDLGGAGELIRLDSLCKEFDDLVAVEDLSLTIKSGEFLVLLGPSGCGKSTTLRMIAGLETPTSGDIYIGEDQVTRTLPQKRDLSMVFQSYALYPHKTVRENLAFPLGKMDVEASAEEHRITRVASLLEIDDLLEKEPGQLSGGQRQRVALGRTIIREPRAFLMDEPLSNLDAKLRVQTRAEIRELQQELGTTTVYVTHDQEEAMSLADRIAVMKDGELQQAGTPAEVYQKPANKFVAGFIGEPAMNFFTANSRGETVELVPESPIELDYEFPEAVDSVGIRPADIHLAPDDDGANGKDIASTTRSSRTENVSMGTLSSPFECDVSIIEPLGNAYELKLSRGNTTFTVRVRQLEESIQSADSVHVSFDLDAFRAFGPKGDVLSSGGKSDD